MQPFLWFLLFLLASRFALILRDAPLTYRQALWLAAVQALALLAVAPSPRMLPLAALIVAANLAGAWRERREPAHAGGYRLAVLLAILLGAGFGFAPAQAVAPNPLWPALADWLGRHFLLPAPLAAGTGGAALLPGVLIGALLVMHEANLLIRLILQLIRVVPHARDGDDARADRELILPPRRPGAPPERLDLREYNAGRFIGVLERLLVYVFVLQGQYAAIGLILAAKSFARFRELDRREFAEYVLIGTLLSVGAAVLVGEGVKALLA
jgi:hypothetical protein